ncbi:MAG: universal stress protein [Cyanothece sp. SIO1E1]|nr:universal stress protein [Cyanothece sp. SIO1E1]
MKKILLCTDGSAFAQIGYEYAAWLAKRVPMEIEVLYVTDRRQAQAVQTHDFSGNLGIDAYQGLLNQLVELEHKTAKINHHRAKIILEAAKQFFLDHGIPTEAIALTHDTGFLVDNFHKFEQAADLIMLGKRGETASFATEHLGSNMERIARASHKPCWVASRDFHPIDRLLFAYDGGKSCQKALRFLVGMPVFKGLAVHMITVAKKHGEDAAIAHLQTAEMTLKANGFKPICHVLHGDVEVAIVDYAETQGIDFLVMGAYGHSRVRHLVIGSTTAQVLRRSHIPVLLFR